MVRRMAQQFSLKMAVEVVHEIKIKESTFVSADMAVAVSGTVGMYSNHERQPVHSACTVSELAFFAIPTVVVYKSSWLTGFIARRIAAQTYVSIPNIIGKDQLIKELLFDDCTVTAVAQQVQAVLSSDMTRQKNINEALTKLNLWNGCLTLPVRPSVLAAVRVMELLEENESNEFVKRK